MSKNSAPLEALKLTRDSFPLDLGFGFSKFTWGLELGIWGFRSGVVPAAE